MIIQKQFISNLASKKMRIDKRGQEEFRPVSIETGVIFKAEGSARVKIGKTEVLAGVKLDVGIFVGGYYTQHGPKLSGDRNLIQILSLRKP